MGKSEAKKEFILKDLSREPMFGMAASEMINKKYRGWLGHAVILPDPVSQINLNFTGPIGIATGVYYSLVFQLGKWEYNGVQKFDEWMNISPVHASYYQITQKQKEDLETRIKSGLASVSQAVADVELLMHDRRKYEEMLHYMGYETKKIDDEDQIDFSIDDKKRKQDNHSLKAMFIDQVDVHTGEGISMRSIVQRWPTLISDFMKLDDEDMDPDGVKSKLDVSRAEAVILVTKNKLYSEWKKMFLPEVRGRYTRIMELVRSRQKSMEEYREWIKPYVARHRIMQEGLSSEGGRRSAHSTFASMQQPSSIGEIELWTWKDFTSPEIYKAPSEEVAKMGKKLDPYDDWTKKNLIFNKDYGLIADYPWITEEWVKKQVAEMTSDKVRWMPKNKFYYTFFIIKFTRIVFRNPQGEEIEDGTFNVNCILMSQNVLLAKLLEMKAKQEEFEQYVNSLLGIPRKIGGGGTVPKFRKDRKNHVSGFFGKFEISPLTFFKHGPYERDLDDRITKFYLAPMVGERYVPVVNYLKAKLGYGT